MTATQTNYVPISRRALDLEDYIDLTRRHIGWIIGPVYAGLVISTMVAFMLPDKYDSKATMQITPAAVSENLVPATVNLRLQERIGQMQGAILSRTSLSNLIQSPNLDLYKEERAKTVMDDVIEEMRKALQIKVTSVGGARQASQIDISFRYRNRLKAKATLDALITRFQEENQTAQRNQQTTLKTMFGDEVTQAKANLQKASDALTKFRLANQGRLPEQATSNIAAMTSLQQEAQTNREQLNRLAMARTAIETNISGIRSQMEAAKLLYANSQDSVASNPASPVARQNQELLQLNRQIDSSELSLQQLLQSFKETHPDVKNLRKNLEVLKQKRDSLAAQQEKDQKEAAAAAMAASQSKDPAPKKADPRLLAVLADFSQRIEAQNAALKANDMERDYREKELNRLSKEVAAYRERLTPSGVDSQFSDLLREKETAEQTYQEALRKQQMTAQSGEVAQRGAGEQLDVLDSPSLPTKPSQPNRYLIVGAGFALSILVGLAMAGLQEAKDTSLKNLKDVRAYTNLPVLGSVPLLENTILVKRKRRIGYLAWSAAVIVGLVAVCGAVVYYTSVTAAQ